MCMVCIGPVGDPNRQDQPSLPQMPVGPFGGRDRDHAPELADRLLAMSVALGGHPSLAVDIALSPSAGPPSASGRRGQPHDAAACQERRRGAGWPSSPACASWAPIRACRARVAEPPSSSASRHFPGTTRVRGGLGWAPAAVWARSRARSARVLSAGATRHHQPPPNHLHAILLDRHQIARPRHRCDLVKREVDRIERVPTATTLSRCPARSSWRRGIGCARRCRRRRLH
jgi:hypothetical protein